jgi:hypothetical protein
METKRTRYQIICDAMNWHFAITQHTHAYTWARVMENEYLRETYKRGFNQPDTRYLEKTHDRRGWANLLRATGGNFDREPILRDIFKALLSYGL